MEAVELLSSVVKEALWEGGWDSDLYCGLLGVVTQRHTVLGCLVVTVARPTIRQWGVRTKCELRKVGVFSFLVVPMLP